MAFQQLNATSFEEVIYDNCESCLVIFFRQNCHVCKEVMPMLERLQPQYDGKFGLYSVDVEAEPNLTQRFSLKGVPSLFFFHDGKLRGKMAGEVSDEDAKEKIEAIFCE